MKILDGKALAEWIYAELKPRAQTFEKTAGRKAHLSVVIVGDDPASHIYVRNKARACKKVGLESEVINLPEQTSWEDLKQKVNALNEDPCIDGFLVQMPLPEHLRGL